ncbi:MAG: carbohydrate binding domain-containing protein, partial [Planctomycetota bacterium]
MKRKDVVLILMFLLIGTSMVDAQEIVNLFDNPGFEEGTGTDVQDIPGWQLYKQSNATGLLSIDTEQAIEGKQCVFIEVTGVPAGGTWNLRFHHTRRFSVKKGVTYTMSFWLKGDAGPITLSPSRAEQNAAGQWGNLASEVVNPTAEWEEYHLTFESPEDRLVMWQLLISNVGQTYYVDHARCYEGEYVPDKLRPQLQADNPYPFDGATDVPREVVLSWTPGEFAPPVNGHKVYLSENFNDVNDGVGGIAQDANSYTPAQRLDFDKTYYWRVDEVNGPPDFTVYEGKVWSFTTELLAYPIQNIAATASSSDVGREPENTINGSGLDDSGLLHGKDPENNMWLSSIAGPQPSWIEFQFDRVYKLHEMWVWNSNESLEPVIGLGFKDASVEYSVDGIDYTTLGATHEFARAPGVPDYAHNTT